MPKGFLHLYRNQNRDFFTFTRELSATKKGKGIIAIWHEKIFTFISELCFGYKGPGCSQFVNGLVLFQRKSV